MRRRFNEKTLTDYPLAQTATGVPKEQTQGGMAKTTRRAPLRV
jgi:hypothetical protein